MDVEMKDVLFAIGTKEDQLIIIFFLSKYYKQIEGL